MTMAMGAGVAIMQVTMPPAVRAWLPDRIGFATAVYTNGLLLGEILPVALMLPLVLPLVGGSWQKGFVFWSVPVALIAGIVMLLAPRSTADGSTLVRRRWWPDWGNDADLASRHHARNDQCYIFRHQRIHSRLHAEQRTERVDQCCSDRPQYRPVACFISVARDSPVVWNARFGLMSSAACCASSRPVASCLAAAPGS